jgi:beta-lactamase regulating signal transducer with metallopeptidase domain
MGSIQHLTGLGLIASGCLRILAAYVLFIAFTRLSSRSHVRHALWLLFLTGAGFYWAFLGIQALTSVHLTHSIAGSVGGNQLASTSGSNTTTIMVPFSWNQCLELTSGILICMYAIGLVLMLFRFVRRRRLLRMAVARAHRVSPGSHSAFQGACHHTGISRCRILELAGLDSPGTAYTWKPLVLLPEGLDLDLDSEQLIDVLCHELIHIRRLDFLWNTLADLVGVVLFFHPAIWLALSKLRRERELASDEAVVELRQGRRTDYALCLTRLARRRVLGCQLAAPSHLALLDSFLALRVQTLLKENRRRSWWKQSAAVSAGLLALMLFFAGWSSLALAIDLALPVPKIVPLTAQEKHSSSSQKVRVASGKPHAFSAKVGRLPPNPPAVHEIPEEPDENARFAPRGGNIESLISAQEIESHVSPRKVDERSTWDEAPPSMPSQSPVSWRRTIAGAAIGALEHVALGGKDVDKDKGVSRGIDTR